MRVACGERLAETAASLEKFAREEAQELIVATINTSRSVDRVADELAQFRPDIILFAQRGIPMASVLRRLCDVAKVPEPLMVVGAQRPSNLVKVQAVHHGLVDVVDLSLGVTHLVERLREILSGASELATDSLWQLIAKPRVLPDSANIPKDEFDADILDLIRIGLNDSDIGKVVFLSAQTVRNRVSAMLRRAQLNNRTQLGWFCNNQILASGVVRTDVAATDSTVPRR